MDRDGWLSRWDSVNVLVVTVDVTGVMLDRAASGCGNPARITRRYSVEKKTFLCCIPLHRVAGARTGRHVLPRYDDSTGTARGEGIK